MLDALPIELVGEIADQLPDIAMVAQLRLVSHAVKEAVDAGSRQWHTAQEVCDADGTADILKCREKTLEFAAKHGLMGAVRRLHPSRKEIVETVLGNACCGGRVEVVRGLRLGFGLTALRLACQNVGGYGLTVEDWLLH